MGFELQRFPNGEVESELICSICKGVLENPLETSCQHLFCGECIHQWLLRCKSCPQCRKGIVKANLRQVLPALKNILNKQKIYCEYKSNGCKELLTIEALPRHVSSCLYVNAPPVSMALTDKSDDGSDTHTAAVNGSESYTYLTAAHGSESNLPSVYDSNMALCNQNTPASLPQHNSYADAVMEATAQGTIKMLDIGNEHEELKLYKRHKRYFNESLRVKLDVWISNRVNFPQDVREDMGLFLARYSLRLGVGVACNGCTKHINRHRYRCLECFDIYLCSDCYLNGKVFGEHRASHIMLELRTTCNECYAYIIQTYYHCEVCDDFDLCLDCYRIGKFPDCHRSSHAMVKGHISPDDNGNPLFERVIEDLELTMLERHRGYYERALLMSPSVWLTLMANQTYRVQLDANFFLARYAFNLGRTSICGSCKRKITGRHFRCLNCINLDLCQVCFMEGKYPNHRSPKESHQIIEFSVRYHGCSAFIIKTRYKCWNCSDFDLCLYCFKKYLYPSWHKSTHKMTKTDLLPRGMPYHIS